MIYVIHGNKITFIVIVIVMKKQTYIFSRILTGKEHMMLVTCASYMYNVYHEVYACPVDT